MSIENNLLQIKENIADALRKSGRENEEIELIAVTKTVDVERIDQAIKLGISNIGENKVQELERKHTIIGNKINYHMIGHLQTNKVRNIIGKTRLVHSLDRISLAKELNRRSEIDNIVTDVLLQVNVSEEESKFGLKVNEVLYFIEEVLDLGNIRIRGLMTMAPFTDDEIVLRKVFKAMAELKKNIANRNYSNISMDYLSMGMTNDYKVAIEEGSNMIRVGSGIFGNRNY